ncbi:hypothetical protein IBX73_05815 [candidate division WOR-3 bacterium]|nr:hypothetical protein [candidate division WOR-3 bacterium]
MKSIILCCAILMMSVYGQEQDTETQDPRAVIEKIRTEYLIRELELTSEQALEFSSRLGELQDIEAEFHHERSEIIEELKELLDSGAADRDIIRSVNRYEDILRKRLRRHLMKMRGIRQMLTPAQQARFLIFQERFKNEIKEMIREVKQLRPDPN